mmetsp:Transcript_54065/g.87499  ORF Transcript_54065/g.87499 Transcript_54065/m.87499 type:complete len:222 (-) Transcript_54065:87-752(-)
MAACCLPLSLLKVASWAPISVFFFSRSSFAPSHFLMSAVACELSRLRLLISISNFDNSVLMNLSRAAWSLYSLFERMACRFAFSRSTAWYSSSVLPCCSLCCWILGSIFRTESSSLAIVASNSTKLAVLALISLLFFSVACSTCSTRPFCLSSASVLRSSSPLRVSLSSSIDCKRLRNSSTDFCRVSLLVCSNSFVCESLPESILSSCFFLSNSVSFSRRT